MNIYQKINAVMKEVDYVKKDAKVQGYSAVTHDAVTALIRQHLVVVGIVVNVNQTDGHFLEMRDLSKEIKQYLYQGAYDVSFINTDDANDKCTVRVHAHAQDTGDKAAGKAMSYATKYAMLKTFSIETGENDESRATKQTDIVLVGENEMIEIEKAAKLKGVDIEKIKAAYALSDLSELAMSRYKEVLTRINNTEKK